MAKQHNPEKIIFNYSGYVLSEVEKSFLWKGLNYSIPPKKLNNADYLVNFELFYGENPNLQVIYIEDIDFIKTSTKYTAPSSFRIYNNNVPQHLSEGEFNALKNLKTNKSSFKNLTKVIL